mmetsp:Transcript_95133/g.188471  ORF Transcript_95133/g.188471 Transcript_95133/m.188471 type:complete len:161 (-) Transcript_95133:234-716(-)
MAMTLLRSKKRTTRFTMTVTAMVVVLASFALSETLMCDSGTPLLGRKAYFDMRVRRVIAETTKDMGIAAAFAQMAMHVAQEIVPLGILMPVGGVLIVACRDANRDRCNQRIGLVQAENRTNISEVLGMTVGICVVILSLTQFVYILIAHMRKRSQRKLKD